jgi:hypothetical protein
VVEFERTTWSTVTDGPAEADAKVVAGVVGEDAVEVDAHFGGDGDTVIDPGRGAIDGT